MTLDKFDKINENHKDFSTIVNLKKYPIDDLENPITQELIKKCRSQLDKTGCSVIPNFILEESLSRMAEEAERLYDKTYWSEQNHNPYMTKKDESLADSHPKRFFQNRTSGFINSDLLEKSSDLVALYNWDVMTKFVAECLGVWPIYPWADPLACCPYGVMKSGSYFPWHFDGNEFTVSVSIRQPKEGGIFEYVPNIRTIDNENYDAVNKILNGGREGVYELEWKPGALQLFKGRFSLHRVTEVTSDDYWITALPTYVLDPQTVNRPERSKQFYGKALPIHYEREAIRPDKLSD